MSTRTDFLCLTISAGDGTRVMDQRDGQYRRKYRVSVKSDATGRRISFNYWDSIHNESLGNVGLNRDGLLSAFWSFVSDAAAGEETFADFAVDSGYDKDSYSARSIHRACKSARERFGRLWHEDREPAWVLDQLAAIGIE